MNDRALMDENILITLHPHSFAISCLSACRSLFGIILLLFVGMSVLKGIISLASMHTQTHTHKQTYAHADA